MKTTIDIADDLIERARIVQKRDEVTLRMLVEEGLRLVLDKLADKPKYRFEPVVVGKPWQEGDPFVDVNALIAEGYEHREAKMFRDAGIGALAVHEPRAEYKVSKRTVSRKRKA